VGRSSAGQRRKDTQCHCERGESPHTWRGDQATVFDHGGGFLDVAKSSWLLKKHRVSDDPPRFPRHSYLIRENLQALNLKTRKLVPGEPVNIRANNLVPGEPHQVILEISPSIGSVTVQVNSVTPKLAPENQNQLFGDDIILAVHQSELTEIGREGDYGIFRFVNAPGTFTIDNPQVGFMRVMVNGDWTNAGTVAADVTVTATEKSDERPALKLKGTIHDGEILAYAFQVPEGINSAQVKLAWKHDWRHYPTNDIDLVLVDPAGNEIDDGATLSTPETVNVDKPAAGLWSVYVLGFDVFGHLRNDGSEYGPKKDDFELTAFTK
jgi:hypothetical protein